MAFWVDAAGRAPGSGRVRKTVASGRHAGYPTGMTAKTTRRDGDSLTRCPTTWSPASRGMACRTRRSRCPRPCARRSGEIGRRA